MITLKDVAKRAGVAISTVSYALNNDPRIPEETRLKVLAAVEEVGYTGKSGKKKSTTTMRQIAICLHTISGGIYSDIVTSMKKVLNVNNCEVFIYVGSKISRIKWMDGLVVLNSRVSNADIIEMTKRHIPVVLMDRDEHIAGAVNVTLDNFDGCYKTTTAVINKGAKNFAFVGGPNTSFESGLRYEGFKKALADKGLQMRNTIVLQSDFTFDGGLNVSHYLLKLPQLPDGIVCANDAMAMGILAGLREEGKEGDVWVSGFDDSVPRNQTRYITAKAEHTHWGALAGYSILQLFDHVRTDTHIKIPVELVEYY